MNQDLKHKWSDIFATCDSMKMPLETYYMRCLY